MRKVLYSPGYGASWITWNRWLLNDPERNREALLLMLEWPPLIAAVERGDKLDKQHPAVQSLLAALALLGVEVHDDPNDGGPMPEHAGGLYLGGLRDLAVATGEGECRIEEHDGNESVIWRNSSNDEWL